MKILGYNYILTANEDADKLDCYGKTFFTTQEIKIAANLAPEQKISTTIHEALHVINESLKLDLTENIICRLETGIYQTLLDNGVDLEPLVGEIERRSK